VATPQLMLRCCAVPGLAQCPAWAGAAAGRTAAALPAALSAAPPLPPASANTQVAGAVVACYGADEALLLQLLRDGRLRPQHQAVLDGARAAFAARQGGQAGGQAPKRPRLDVQQ
jgi:hypothetical protein